MFDREDAWKECAYEERGSFWQQTVDICQVRKSKQDGILFDPAGVQLAIIASKTGAGIITGKKAGAWYYQLTSCEVLSFWTARPEYTERTQFFVRSFPLYESHFDSLTRIYKATRHHRASPVRTFPMPEQAFSSFVNAQIGALIYPTSCTSVLYVSSLVSYFTAMLVLILLFDYRVFANRSTYHPHSFRR